MIFSGIKKWEMYVFFAVSSAGAVVEAFRNISSFTIPFWVIPVVYVPFVAVMFLWRTVLTLISYPKLRKHGERAEAVVTEYRREQMEMGSGIAEIIRYADKKGTKYERALFTMPMLTRKVGRRYTIYFEPEKEDAFIIVPQCFIAAAMWVVLWALMELPAVIMLLLYNGG
ncbi:MAG: hypothetical protein K2N38_13795 [Oscillospiraceae bacterium]|nr:hypothetical protein [Oscillospiraceae bacterium]